MELKVKEAADTAGVSVRTLHHYDRIGLLKPAALSESGYRLYSNSDLEKLQRIMFFRELDFSLNDIRIIMDNPDIDRVDMLEKQKEMLIEKRERLDSIINLVQKTITINRKGQKMNEKELFKSFDMSEIEKHREEYAEEAKKRWGENESYDESIRRTSAYTEEDWKMINEESALIYNEFAALVDEGRAGSKEAAEAVRHWQEHISRYYYECTDTILNGLGELYSADERFKKKIDNVKPGLAVFMSSAIISYCKNRM